MVGYYDSMRSQVIAFALGVLCLQMQPVLPVWANGLWVAAIFLPFLSERDRKNE